MKNIVLFVCLIGFVNAYYDVSAYEYQGQAGLQSTVYHPHICTLEKIESDPILEKDDPYPFIGFKYCNTGTELLNQQWYIVKPNWWISGRGGRKQKVQINMTPRMNIHLENVKYFNRKNEELTLVGAKMKKDFETKEKIINRKLVLEYFHEVFLKEYNEHKQRKMEEIANRAFLSEGRITEESLSEGLNEGVLDIFSGLPALTDD